MVRGCPFGIERKQFPLIAFVLRRVVASAVDSESKLLALMPTGEPLGWYEFFIAEAVCVARRSAAMRVSCQHGVEPPPRAPSDRAEAWR